MLELLTRRYRERLGFLATLLLISHTARCCYPYQTQSNTYAYEKSLLIQLPSFRAMFHHVNFEARSSARKT